MRTHLHFLTSRRSDSESDSEDEEEFYYDEIQIPVSHLASLRSRAAAATSAPAEVPRFSPAARHVPVQPLPQQQVRLSRAPLTNGVTTAAFAQRPPLLADHMDMARPPHENPEYSAHPLGFQLIRQPSTSAHAAMQPPHPQHQPQHHHQPQISRIQPHPPAQGQVLQAGPSVSGVARANPISIPFTFSVPANQPISTYPATAVVRPGKT